MKSKGKVSPVPIQKGKIVSDQRTLQHDSRSNITREDERESKLRFDGQTLRKTMIPKQ